MTPTRTALAALALGALGLPALAQPALAQDVAYEISNVTGLTVMELYTSPAGTGEFGDDILGSQIIAPGEAGIVTIADGSARCDYDLLVVFDDGQEFNDTVNVCEVASYTLQQ